MAITPPTPRLERAAFAQLAPDANAALIALSKAIDASGLEKTLTELVKLRASQINGCAFCLQFHLNVARGAGVSLAQLDQLAAWKDSSVFATRERAALAWTEALTCADQGAEDALYLQVREQFSESELAFLTAAVGLINAWNRIAVGLKFTPPAAQ